MEKKSSRFSTGDKVRIRTREEIERTLGADCGLGGCLVTGQMYGHSGEVHRILRVVHNIFDEYEFRMYGVKSTMYILEGLICDGSVHDFEHRCDRSCHLLWHERWLEEAAGKRPDHE